MDARKTVRTVAIAALVTLLFAPAAGAAWQAPDDASYDAEERIVVETSADRSQLASGPGALAWTRDDWDAQNQTTARDSQPQIAYVERPIEAENVTVHHPEPDASNSPAVGGGFLAWRAFPNTSKPGGPDLGDDAELRVLDLDTGEKRTVGPTLDRTSPPFLNGTELYWATWNLASEEPPEIHRLDLDSGERRSWESPEKCEPDGVRPAGPWILIWCEDVFAWQPASDVHRLVASDVISMDTDAPWVVTTEYRAEDEGRGTNLYIHDLANASDRRLSFGNLRSAAASIDEPLVAWADSREENHTRGDPLTYKVYFQDLRTRTEYKVEDTQNITSAPHLVDEKVYVGDDEGRLIELTLPGEEDRLLAEPSGAIRETNETRQLDVTVNSSAGNESIAWDTDGDGTFETPGNLTVDVEEDKPPNGTLQGVVVDEEDRHGVVNVDVREVYHAALAAYEGNDSRDTDREVSNGSSGSDDASAGANGSASPGPEDGPREPQLPRQPSKPSQPTPGVGSLLAAGLLAVASLLASSGRRRG